MMKEIFEGLLSQKLGTAVILVGGGGYLALEKGADANLVFHGLLLAAVVVIMGRLLQTVGQTNGGAK